jgi:hypothetical protein
MELSPHGFRLDSEHQMVSEPIITVATDLPVHKTLHVNSLTEGGSPFLLLTKEMGPSFMVWKSKLDSLQRLRHLHFDHARQLVDYARSGNWPMVRQCLETMFDETPPTDDIGTAYLCYRVIGVLYAPLISLPEMASLLDEYYLFLNDCYAKKTAAYTALLQELSTLPLYQNLRTKTLSAFLRVLSHFDAFIVGLLFNEMPQHLKQQISDYRVFRDDYSVVKVLYQDLFELTSQLMIFLGAIVNLSTRNDAWHYVTGAQSYNAFKKKPAFERLQILSELPKLSNILGAVSRPMRNSIGHFSADYEPCSGNLRYDDGSHENYIVFLGEFYSAVKALWFMMVFVEKSDIDMMRLGVAIPV